MSRTIVDVHVLQTVPPSNLNRDDTGSPKTAIYGGVRRARVSSQAWKRAARTDFNRHLDDSELGTRTKRVVELVAGRIADLVPGSSVESCQDAAVAVLEATGIGIAKPRKGEIPESGYLLFLSSHQIDALAGLGAGSIAAGTLSSIDKAAAKAAVKGKNSIDLALFGRMVADVTDLNVDASAQVAHALSVHAVETEYDFFTAVDDHKSADPDEDAGAGMMGTIEFNSATLYRYATVDVDALQANLGDAAATARGVEAFVRSFVTSMPTGKQNTFANRTLPDAVVVIVRDDQPVSLVGAFEQAIPDGLSAGRVRAAAEALVGYARDVQAAYGNAPVHVWNVAVGERASAVAEWGEPMTLDGLVDSLGQLVSGRLDGAK